MSQEYFVLSNFGVRYFAETYVDSDTIPSTGTNEISHVLSCNLGTINKDTKTYKTLGGNGWDHVAALGQSQDDATFECVRVGIGGVYAGVPGTTTYTKIRDWFLKSTAQGGQFSPKVIIEVVPRGAGQYEGTAYFVTPKRWGPGTKNTEDGQVYTFDVTPFGPQIPLIVSYDPDSDTFTFTKAANNVATAVIVTGAGGVTSVAKNGTLQMSATVLPEGANQIVTWSVVPGTGNATINSNGLLRGVSEGTVTVVATTVDGSGVAGSLVITVTDD